MSEEVGQLKLETAEKNLRNASAVQLFPNKITSPKNKTPNSFRKSHYLTLSLLYDYTEIIHGTRLALLQAFRQLAENYSFTA